MTSAGPCGSIPVRQELCGVCGSTREFRKDGITRFCRTCQRKSHQKYKKTAKGKQKSKRHRTKNKEYYRLYHIQRTYGLTKEEYDSLLTLQQNVCAICETSFAKAQPNVDHNHITGEVRGLLCSSCNQGIGQFRENTTTLRKAIGYINSYAKNRHKISRSCAQGVAQGRVSL